MLTRKEYETVVSVCDHLINYGESKLFDEVDLINYIYKIKCHNVSKT